MPGVGPLLAAELVASLPELGTLSSRQEASLVGVAPHPRQSGAARRRGRCQGGRARLRRVLSMAALPEARSNKPLAALQARLRAAGKPRKVALAALMRKMVVTANAMLKTGTDRALPPG